tara:strand:+ start:3161 stop:3712 length:552 start_codon:yes stop_codon:yes gene_type:complete
MLIEDILQEKWSDKYKKSINCSNPKGFSQKAHCAGKKKNESFPNRYSSTSTNNAGVTTTKFAGGGKSVSNDAGTTTYNAAGRKTNYKSPTVGGFNQELKFKGGPRIDNVKNTYKSNGVTRTTNAIGKPTSTTVNYGDAKVSVDNKGNKSAAFQTSDKSRVRVSTRQTPAARLANLNKLKNIGS